MEDEDQQWYFLDELLAFWAILYCAAAALRTGREFRAYCLGARETAYCLMETEAWMEKEKVIAHDAVDRATRA